MIDVEEILAGHGISINEEETPVEENTSQEDDNLSDVNVDDVLSNYGFTGTPSEDTEEDIEEDDAEEESQSVAEEVFGEITESEHQTVEETSEATEPTVEEGLIPPNSPTLLLDDSTSRFSGAEWYNEIQKAKVILAGLGGIGSHFCFNLARMSPATIVMYDDDIVDTTNMSGQFYGRNDIGRCKVDAMEAVLYNYTSASNIYAVNDKFRSTSEAGDIMICGFDSMTARSIFFESWCKHIKNKTAEEKAKCLYIDGRLSLSVMQIFCITGNDEYNINRYKKEFLFSDSDADETVCSMKQTTYLASMIGAMMTNLFTNFVANTLDPIIPYTLPFFTEYDAQYMIFKTEN